MRMLLTVLGLLALLGDVLQAGDAKEPTSKPTTHWAFVLPVRPVEPQVANPAWARNPIDLFVAEQHEKRGLTRHPEADRATLLRRVYLDLIGLPPTPQQLHAFLSDPSTDAYEKVVDELLASPRYGERWGRHWMDVWRYSDWAGYMQEVRDSQPHVWRWRDWIIESLNADKPYDRMVMEMLAGDELAPDDPRVLRATGYLVRSWYKFNRNVWLENTVEHASKAFLGLTVNCAKCHDHKYDPISQKEHYQLRAFFEPEDIRTDRVPGEPDTGKDGLARIYDAHATDPTFLFVRGDEREPAKDDALAPAVPAVLGGRIEVEPVSLPPRAYYPGLREYVRKETLAAADAEVEKAEAAIASSDGALAKAKKYLNDLATTVPGAPTSQPVNVPSAKPADADTGDSIGSAWRVIVKAEGNSATARMRLRVADAERRFSRARIAADDAKYASPAPGNAEELAAKAARAERALALARAQLAHLQAMLDLESLRATAEQSTSPAAEAEALKQPAEREKPGQTEKKLADAEKKLAEARKAMEGATVALDQQTTSYTPLGPVYPATSTGRRLALARWIVSRENPLAARVAVNHIWMRHFGEPLVPTVFDFGLNGRPPTNQPLLDWLAVEFMDSGWNMKHLHRLIVTSATYRMSSSEDPRDARNRKVDPDNLYLWRANSRRLESEIVRDSVLAVSGQLDLSVGGSELDQNAGSTVPRRSIYFRTAPEKQMMFLRVFDAPGPGECYRRIPTVMPQQALAMANGPMALGAARKIAGELSNEARDDDACFIAAAYEQVLARHPSDQECQTCLRFLSDQRRLLSDPSKLTAFAAGEDGPIRPSPDPRQRAREDLVQVLLNHNDFVTIR